MSKSTNNDSDGEDPDFDIIQLLNTKKRNKEILSITNAAVDALSSHEHGKSKLFLATGTCDEASKENIADFSNLSSSHNASFSGKQKVRIPSRLLREIKSPLERRENDKSSSEHDSSPRLFTSPSSSNQSSIQASGPIPTVIKYSSKSYEDIDIKSRKYSHHHTSPVVIKHQTNNTVGSSTSSYQSDFNTSQSGNNIIKQENLSQYSQSVIIRETRPSDIERIVNTENNPKRKVKNPGVEKPIKPQMFLTGKPQEARVSTLYQGAPSTGVIMMPDSEKGQVKAVSFSGSGKEKATKEILSKKQQSKVAVRRIVQPKFVTTTSPAEHSEDTTNLTSNNAHTTDKSTAQLPSTIEKRISDLMTTLGAIETKCQESRHWQVQHQIELDRGLQQRDERRLQNLEDMQKQLLECQLKNAASIQPTIPYAIPPTSGISGTTYGLSTTNVPPPTITQELPTHHISRHPTEQVPTHHAYTTHQQGIIKQPAMVQQPSVTQVPPTRQQHHHQNPGVVKYPSERPIMYSSTQSKSEDHPPRYSTAEEHKTPSSFKTTVYTKPQVISSGLKRKFVRNTRTQTSPQYSTSSSEMSSSPLETPLPRKRPPIPMSRVSKTDRDSNRKHVHFDTPSMKHIKEQDKQREYETKIASNPVGDQSKHGFSSQVIKRPSTSPLKSPGSSDYVVNDIGKLRQKLKDALKETEQAKLSLRNLHENIHAQISDDDILAPPDHSRPYPLDAYLRATRDIPEESDSVKSEDIVLSEKVEKRSCPAHYTDALCILRDVQKRKETLETNLLSLTRQHEEQHLYKLVDDLASETTNNETIRIRKEVAKKIDEISNVVQTELREEKERKQTLEKEAVVENKKNAKFAVRSGVPLSTERRAKLRNTGKENQPRNKTTVKPKTTKPVTKQPVTKQPVAKRPVEDTPYVSRVYGRNDHVPRRTTLKPSYIQHQSPVKSTLPASSGRKNIKQNERFHNDSTTTSSDDSYNQAHFIKHNPKYYFQPSQVTVKPHSSKHIRTPLPGELLSMAIPLGKPKTDPALRLPIHIMQDTTAFSPIKPDVRSIVKQPNVAVISIKDDNSLVDDSQTGKTKKIKKAKEKITLEKQILPNVDIDTTSISDISEPFSPKTVGPQIIPCPEPQPRPGASEYEEFKDYEGVQNVHEMDERETSFPGETSVISLHGSKPRVSSYQGPAFPPQNIPPPAQDNLYGVQPKTVGETLEEKALEWIEKELLARALSEIAPSRPDPTSVWDRTPSFISEASSTEPDLLATIGQRGIQLFVDAGIPVDNELIQNLIVEVLKEKVASVIGYPKPLEQPSPEQQEDKPPDDEYSDDLESLSEEQSRVETPVQTPSTDSRPASKPGSHISTPEQTIGSDLSVSLAHDDVAKGDVDNTIEEGRLEESGHGSPVATPFATPTASPPASPLPVATPETSEQEQLASVKTGIETPEMTVSMREKTPEESPEGLKEQTFVDSGSDEEVKESTPPPVVQMVVQPAGQVQFTNSPSSITTTYSTTRSTMGTVATDDEISEGEQLQPFVHIGQYSEGEFVVPAAMTSGVDHMATMHEIPDDIFDGSDATGKKHDVFKQAVAGLLRLDKEPGERLGVEHGETTDDSNENGTISIVDEISRSEGEVGHDVVSALLQKIRQLPERTPRRMVRHQQPSAEQDTHSAGEFLETDNTVWRKLPKAESGRELSPSVWRTLPRMVSGNDMSPGEVTRPNQPMVPTDDTLNHPQGSSVFDSDENNNESENSQSDHQNQMLDTNNITPKRPSTFNIIPPVSSTPTQFPRILQVTPVERDSSPSNISAGEESPGTKPRFTIGTTDKSPLTSPEEEKKHGYQGDVTIETISDIETGLLDEKELDKPERIELKVPTEIPDESPSLSEEPLTFEYDTIADTSLSGGELP